MRQNSSDSLPRRSPPRSGAFVAALVVSGVSLSASSASAYKHKESAAGDPVHWNKPLVMFRLSAEARALLAPGRVEAVFQEAAELWITEDNAPVIALEEGEPEPLGYHPRKSTNGVYVADEWPYSRRYAAVTVTSYSDQTGALLDTDILLNPNFNLIEVDEEDRAHGREVDLGRLLTHELGHCLGLEESDVAEAMMNPSIPRGRRVPEALPVDDHQGLIALYANVSFPASSSSSSLSSSADSPMGCSASGSSSGTIGLMLLALVGLRRRASC